MLSCETAVCRTVRVHTTSSYLQWPCVRGGFSDSGVAVLLLLLLVGVGDGDMREVVLAVMMLGGLAGNVDVGAPLPTTWCRPATKRSGMPPPQTPGHWGDPQLH